MRHSETEKLKAVANVESGLHINRILCFTQFSNLHFRYIMVYVCAARVFVHSIKAFVYAPQVYVRYSATNLMFGWAYQRSTLIC